MRIILFLISLSVFASDSLTVSTSATLAEVVDEAKTVTISRKYESGAYLIYDCEEQYFVCVSKFSYRDCKEKRRLDYLTDKRILSCAPLKEFTTFKECVGVNYQKIYEQVKKEFCLNTKPAPPKNKESLPFEVLLKGTNIQ